MRQKIIAASAAVVGAIAPAMAEEFTLYKNPQCGCCDAYADYLREHGHDVTVHPTHELVRMSRAAGIPDPLQGCHLAHVGEYVVSGHVPLSAIEKLLAERPAIRGITLPGMPTGSPGMGGPKTGPFSILAIGDGEPTIYAVE